MKLHTAAEVISFAKRLENDSAKLYGDLTRRYTKNRDFFLSSAKENESNPGQIDRAYYGIITDAIEGCFSFELESDVYIFDTKLGDKAGYWDALNKALEMEEKITKFYLNAAEQAKPLMADTARNFLMLANKKRGRIPKLKSLLDKEA